MELKIQGYFEAFALLRDCGLPLFRTLLRLMVFAFFFLISNERQPSSRGEPVEL